MPESHKLPHAADFMNRKVLTVQRDMPLSEIVDFLLTHNLSNAPVVDQSTGRRVLEGFLSERDCLAALANESFFGIPAMPQTAASIMRRHPVCVDPGTELFALASVFVHHGFRHLPVTTGPVLEGLVSRRDVLQAVHSWYQQETDTKARQRFRPDLTKIVNHRFIVSD